MIAATITAIMFLSGFATMLLSFRLGGIAESVHWRHCWKIKKVAIGLFLISLVTFAIAASFVYVAITGGFRR